MFVKKITYTDEFTGEKVTDPFYFNLTQAEIIDLEATLPGGIAGSLRLTKDGRDPEVMINFLKTIIGKAYGERPYNSRKFVKSKENTDAFLASEAFSELLFELLEDENAANEFFTGVFPDMKKMNSRIEAIRSKGEKQKALESPDVVVE